MEQTHQEGAIHLTKGMTKAAKKAFLETHPREVKTSKIPSFAIYGLAIGVIAVTAGLTFAKRRKGLNSLFA